MAGLKIQNLYKNFNIKNENIKVLNDLNIHIQDESFVTIVGKSGCGKTTLLRILCGLEKQSEGSIEFIGDLDESNIKRKVGIVFQEPRLMPWLTVEQNMAFSLIKERNKDLAYDRIHKHLKMLGLENFKDAYPHQISGGMAQRVALGRTLCHDPEIILMDEPLGALDAFNRRKLQKEFINIFLENKKTIIFVTHDVDEAVYLGEKVIVMDKGSIIKEIPVNLDYYRDFSSKEFLEIREDILNLFFK
ncbi:ABC transporter ATP-binding protein [Clostridiaceae bacterium UIB06]|uniref:ABC transporter ATP-binding protein n=1 Tax=Clostridium thailandense TaxID=2794346 RepID=A0A949X483_9CLOT|nr:ABC transporter ATP-binding protein [Clostridium thailandense]MBV7276004.1 ABC transporter ATP-binding protein [Clostridium thailandense]MCH5138090.1 ABC transporter ATP-binding protein [Clostridiaceae bacterium UIB06]